MGCKLIRWARFIGWHLYSVLCSINIFIGYPIIPIWEGTRMLNRGDWPNTTTNHLFHYQRLSWALQKGNAALLLSRSTDVQNNVCASFSLWQKKKIQNGFKISLITREKKDAKNWTENWTSGNHVMENWRICLVSRHLIIDYRYISNTLSVPFQVHLDSFDCCRGTTVPNSFAIYLTMAMYWDLIQKETLIPR